MNSEVLARALPGCERFEANPDGSYRTEMSVGIAAVKGKYHGRVEIQDAVPPASYRMKVEGQGSGGFLKGEGTLTLIAQGAETEIRYSGEAQVGGIIASVGQRLMQGAAQQLVRQCFAALAREVAARLAAEQVATPPVEAPGPAPTETAHTPTSPQAAAKPEG